MNTVAIFDLDGTLISGYAWKGFRRYYFKYKKRKVPLMLLSLMLYLALWPLAKSPLLDKEKYIVWLMTKMDSVFKGEAREELEKSSRWVVDSYILGALRQDIFDIMRWHKENGHIVVLVSAVFQELLEIMGQELGITYVLGTRLETMSGKYTGRIVPPFCFGKGKARLLKEFLEQREMKVDLLSSFAYADNISDVPVMEMVGNPVAAYPDKELFRLAGKRGWRIMDG